MPSLVFRAEWPIEDVRVSREQLKYEAKSDAVITLQQEGLIPLRPLDPKVQSEHRRVVLAVEVIEKPQRSIHA